MVLLLILLLLEGGLVDMGQVQGAEPRQLDERRRISSSGIEHLKESEGFSSAGEFITPQEKLEGIVTVGHSSTGRVKEGESITTEQGEQFLREDISDAEDAVNRLVTADISKNEFDALVSLVFNVGQGNFEKSNALKALNAGERDKFIFEAFDKSKGFVKQGGKTMKGLQNRRARERELFERKE